MEIKSGVGLARMKPTGRLIVTANEQTQLVSITWTGGRRVAATSEFFKLINQRPRVGQIVKFGYAARIVALQPWEGTYQDSYILMREGLLARFMTWYVRRAVDWASPLYQWECKWLWRTTPVEGGVYRRRSLTALLLRWV
jgi:hypothetical protein